MVRVKSILCAFVLIGGVCFAQNKNDTAPSRPAQAAQEEAQPYQLVFVAQEVEGGKVINARRYVTDMVVTSSVTGSGSIRAGSKVPIVTGPVSASNTAISAQFTYVDIGFNVDFHSATLVGNKASLWVAAELSSAESDVLEGQNRHPVIRENRWTGMITVPLGKPTMIFSSDALDTKRTMQIELTVTPMK